MLKTNLCILILFFCNYSRFVLGMDTVKFQSASEDLQTNTPLNDDSEVDIASESNIPTYLGVDKVYLISIHYPSFQFL